MTASGLLKPEGMWGEDMACLSREDIEKIAEGVICQYKAQYLPERRMCYMVDASELAEMLGFTIEYVHITRDGSILGQTSSGPIWTEIFDDNMEKVFFELDGSTILVDKRLLSVTWSTHNWWISRMWWK